MERMVKVELTRLISRKDYLPDNAAYEGIFQNIEKWDILPYRLVRYKYFRIYRYIKWLSSMVQWNKKKTLGYMSPMEHWHNLGITALKY